MVSELPSSAALADDIDPPPETMTPTLPYGVGIDTHKTFIQVCILYQTPNATERVEREFKTSWTDLSAARAWIERVLTEKGHFQEGDLLRYVIESTGCYHMPVCQALGGTPTVINPMLAGPSRRKTDVLDARMLAHHSIVALWRPSYVVDVPGEVLRCLLAMRNEASRNASRLINRINNHALRFGHTLGRDGSLADMEQRAIIEDMCRGSTPTSESLGPNGLPEPARCIFLDSYRLYDMYKVMVADYHRKALQFVKANDWPIDGGRIKGKVLLENLISIPSIGEVTALTWLSVIHDPRRFTDKKQVAAFCGSDPSVKVSAGKTTSHIKRKGNARLHHVLKNCASQLVRNHKDPLGQWGYNILRRHRKGSWGRAISAVARRLAIMLWHVHRTGAEFSYEQYRFMLVDPVEEMPIDDMDIHQRYKSMLKEKGLNTSGEVARAFMSALPQQKGIGVACLTAVKTWLDSHKVLADQHPASREAASKLNSSTQNPAPPSPPDRPLPPVPPSPPHSGKTSLHLKAAEFLSEAKSSDAPAPTSPPTKSRALSAKKSRTASPRTKLT